MRPEIVSRCARLFTQPSQVRTEAIAVMKELGIDISGQRSKSLTEFRGQEFDFIIGGLLERDGVYKVTSYYVSPSLRARE
jgi:protein-tyrosine-phosphatase